MTAAPALPSASVPLDSRLLLEDCPTRDKITLNIQEDGKLLQVTLLVPLDPQYAAEGAARKLFGSPIDVKYSVEMNLPAERKLLAENLRDMYRTTIGEILRREQIEPLNALQLSTVLAPLARQGWSVFYRLFEIREAQNYSAADVPKVREAVHSALSRSQVIVITSPMPLFPWALLFDDPGFDESNLSTLSPQRFWGFQHEIQEEIEGTSPRIRLRAFPQIVAAICSEIDKGRHSAPGHPFVALRNKVTPIATAPELGLALARFDADCFYFYGHADHRDPPVPAESWIQLRSVRLSVSDLETRYHAPVFTRDLVVGLLNGCRMAPLNCWDAGSVVGFLCLRGDRRLCCVAPVAEVPEAFAAEMARRFWEQFLVHRHPIGCALVEARRAMLAEARNPLGLLYSLFGRVDTRLEEPPEKEANG